MYRDVIWGAPCELLPTATVACNYDVICVWTLTSVWLDVWKLMSKVYYSVTVVYDNWS